MFIQNQIRIIYHYVFAITINYNLKYIKIGKKTVLYGLIIFFNITVFDVFFDLKKMSTWLTYRYGSLFTLLIKKGNYNFISKL